MHAGSSPYVLAWLRLIAPPPCTASQLHRIDALSRESHARLDASASHAAGLEDTLNHHISVSWARQGQTRPIACSARSAFCSPAFDTGGRMGILHSSLMAL